MSAVSLFGMLLSSAVRVVVLVLVAAATVRAALDGVCVAQFLYDLSNLLSDLNFDFLIFIAISSGTKLC